MKIIALGHRVLVKMAKTEDLDPLFKSAKAAGIVIADSQEKQRREGGTDRGWVQKVGPDAFKAFHLNANGTLDGFEPWVKEGDYIAFAKYGGMVVSSPDQDYRYVVMNDEDVVALLEDPNG